MKYVTTLALLLAFVLATPVHAESGSSGASNTSDSTVIACLKTAVAAREASIGAGWDTFSAAVDTAYSTRKSALDAAYSKSSAAEVKKAVRDAWKAFKTSLKEARGDWKEARRDAWKTFKTAKKSCRGSKDLEDSSNESTEAGA